MFLCSMRKVLEQCYLQLDSYTDRLTLRLDSIHYLRRLHEE